MNECVVCECEYDESDLREVVYSNGDCGDLMCVSCVKYLEEDTYVAIFKR